MSVGPGAEPNATPELAPWKYVLAAMLPLFVALPIGFATSALMVHGAFISRGLRPWEMDPASLLAAFGPLELSLGGLGNQLAFLALLLPSLRHSGRRRLLLSEPEAARMTTSVTLLAALGMYALSTALALVVGLLGLEREGTLGQLNDVMGQLDFGERLSLLPVLALVAGVVEELFFRGLLFRRLAGIVSPKRVVLLTAIAFGFAHLDPVHSIAAGVMGLYLGWLRVRTGRVWPGIVAHVFSNGAVVLSHGWLDEMSDVPLFGLLAATMVFALSVWALRRRLSAGYTRPPKSIADPG